MKKLLIIMSIVLILTSGCGKDEKNKEENNKDTEVKEEQTIKSFGEETIEGINISGFNMLYENNSTIISAKITNTTNNDISLEKIEMVLYDKEGKVMTQRNPSFYIGGIIKAGESKLYQSGISGNVASVEKIEYKLVK